MTDKTNDKDLHPQILRMKKIAENNGGALLDMEWRGREEKYSFLYDKNNPNSIFTRTQKSIMTSSRGWPDYKNKPYLFLKNQTTSKSSEEKLKEMADIAVANDAILLSKDWNGTKEYYEFQIGDKVYKITYQMAVKYKWPENLNHYEIRSNNKQDANSKFKDEKLKEISELATKYNFELLSTEYVRKKTPLKFLDKNIDEHFYISHKAILEGKFENQYYGKTGLIAEPICKQALEHLFGYKFEKRQDILTKEITGRNSYLELDGYCEELKIAFEYQGHPSHWNVNHYRYEKTKQKDDEKKKYCTQLGITLIQIPDLKRNRDLIAQNVMDVIVTLVKKICDDYNIKEPTLNMSPFIIDYEKISHSKVMLKKIQDLANENGAILLSKKWKGQDSYYEFEKEGKQFSINNRKLQEIGWPKDLKNFLAWSDGHKKNEEDLLNELKEYAKSKNAKLIDEKWINVDYKYTFQSLEDENIIFKASKKNINSYNKRKEGFNGKDSYLHKKKNQAFEKLKNLAEKNNCQLLSEEWTGIYDMYEFSDGIKIFKIRYEYLSKKGWPKDLEKYIKQSQASKTGYQNRE